MLRYQVKHVEKAWFNLLIVRYIFNYVLSIKFYYFIVTHVAVGR